MADIYFPIKPATRFTHTIPATDTTGGTYTWVAPTGVTSVTLTLVGAGGGGGVGARVSNERAGGGGGGGGGALIENQDVTGVTAAQTYTFVIGNGGVRFN